MARIIARRAREVAPAGRGRSLLGRGREGLDIVLCLLLAALSLAAGGCAPGPRYDLPGMVDSSSPSPCVEGGDQPAAGRPAPTIEFSPGRGNVSRPDTPCQPGGDPTTTRGRGSVRCWRKSDASSWSVRWRRRSPLKEIKGAEAAGTYFTVTTARQEGRVDLSDGRAAEIGDLLVSFTILTNRPRLPLRASCGQETASADRPLESRPADVDPLRLRDGDRPGRRLRGAARGQGQLAFERPPRTRQERRHSSGRRSTHRSILCRPCRDVDPDAVQIGRHAQAARCPSDRSRVERLEARCTTRATPGWAGPASVTFGGGGQALGPLTRGHARHAAEGARAPGGLPRAGGQRRDPLGRLGSTTIVRGIDTRDTSICP